VAMTPEQRAQAVDLLADGLLVWQVADRVGVDRRAVACVKANWSGRIQMMRRARQGLGIDGAPMPPIGRAERRDAMADAMANAGPATRTVTFFAGDDGRLVYTLDDPDAAIIRAELSAEWTPAELSRLCRKLGAMRDGKLKGFVQKLRGVANE